LELFTKIFESFGQLLAFKNKAFKQFLVSQKRTEFLTFNDIVDILIYSFIYLFILIIFDV